MSRIVAGLIATGAIVASSLLVATPAQADPGDASAYGAFTGFEFDLGPIVIDEYETIGTVSVIEPGIDSFSEDDVTLIDALLATVTIDQVDTVAESTASYSTASSAALETSANLFGISIVSFDTAASTVYCPADGTPTADAALEGLRIFGIPVELSDDEVPTATDTITLPSDAMIDGDEYDLSGLTLTVTVSQRTETTATYATASAFELAVFIEGDYEEEEVELAFFGGMGLAGATCESPDAPVAPAQLAATGADFTPGTLLAPGILGLGILAAGLVLLVARRRAVS